MAQTNWIDVRDGGSNKLLFRYDPGRRLVSIKHSGMAGAVVVDLVFYDAMLEQDEGEDGAGAILGAVNRGTHGKTLPDGL